MAYHLQRYPEAEEAYRKAIKISPDGSRAYNSLAWFLCQKTENIEEVVLLSQKAVALDSENIVMQHTLITLLVKSQRWSEAKPYFKHFIQTAKALQILDETEVGERWRPLRETLMVIVSGNERYLNGVAPEIREPAQAILKQLRLKWVMNGYFNTNPCLIRFQSKLSPGSIFRSGAISQCPRICSVDRLG